MSSNTIVLKGKHRHEEDPALAALSPGHLLKRTAAGKVKKHDTQGGAHERAVAKEDGLQGRTVNDAYAADDIVSYALLEVGAEAQFLLKAGTNYAADALLFSNGDGTLCTASEVFADAATDASQTITDTVVETAFDNTVIIAAGVLQAEDVVHVRASCKVLDNNANDTLTLKLYLNATEVAATAAVDVADNDVGFFDALFTFRTVGAAGTFVASGTQGLGVPGTVTAKPFYKDSTAVDTTGAITFSVKATWSAAHADNQVRMDTLTLNVQRAGVWDAVGYLQEAVDLSGVGAVDTLAAVRVV